MSYSISKTSLHVLVVDESADISNMLKKALFCTGHSATVPLNQDSCRLKYFY